MTKSYTLYSHSPAETNFCIANLQVREDNSGEIVIERSVDSTTVEIYGDNLRKIILDLQDTLTKGECMTLNICNLNEQEESELS